MSHKFPNAADQYGAGMGRTSYSGVRNKPYKFRMERVKLDSGGYDNGGAYWGRDLPLYYARADDPSEEDDSTELFLRAFDRADAKAQVVDLYPNARFFS